jgi:type I restriction enzyme S subunit
MRPWKEVHLADVAEVRTGIAKNPKRPKDPVTLPYLRVANVQQGFFDLTEVKTLVVDRADVERYSVRPADVLLTEGGDFDKLGRGHVWSGEIEPCLHQNHVFAVRPDPARLDPDYLSVYAGSRRGRAYFLSCSKQSTNLASINATQLRQMPVLLPPIEQQRAIAGIIDSWRRAGELTAKLIGKKLLWKRVVMGRLFGTATHPRWPLLRLRDVTRELRATNGDQALGAADVRSVTKTAGMTPMKARLIGSDLGRYKVVPPDAFAYNPMRLNIGSLARWNGAANALVSPDYVVFRTIPEDLDPKFLDHFRRSEVWERFMALAGNGSVRVRIYYDDLASIRIPVPPLSEQLRIVKVLDLVDEEIRLLSRARALLAKQAEALTEELIAGRRKVGFTTEMAP